MLFKRFQQNWKAQFNHLSTFDCHLLLAVSGGIDSIVLTDLISKAGFDFTIAHCNFQLRGEESQRDEAFVRSLGEKYNKEVLVKYFDTKVHAATTKLS
ncbi:MAG TPA: ATP-binding protein, partial [Panacibacter sp.]|nr:ATP-binding protein [Panacibacter sp.]